jgi:hypothetical protein
MTIVDIVQSTWAKRQGARTEDLRRLEPSLGIIWPSDYVDLMTWSDGGEGRIGSRYLSLWRVGELASLNADYMVQKYVAGLVAVGTDGGGECYGFDCRAPGPPLFVHVPLGDLDWASVEKCADSMEQALRLWASS